MSDTEIASVKAISDGVTKPATEPGTAGDKWLFGMQLAINGRVASVGSGATFDLSNGPARVQIATLAGASGATVQMGNNNNLFIANASTEFAGAINGTGGLEISAGTQTLSGTNTYINVTQIDSGATVSVRLEAGGQPAQATF